MECALFTYKYDIPSLITTLLSYPIVQERSWIIIKMKQNSTAFIYYRNSENNNYTEKLVQSGTFTHTNTK